MGSKSVNQILHEPTIQWVAGLVTAIATILGAAFFVDSRYAHAQELVQFKSEVAQELHRGSIEMRLQTQELRRQTIEDKLFELDSKDADKLTSTEKAIRQRYRRQLTDINQTINQLEDAKRRVTQ